MRQPGLSVRGHSEHGWSPEMGPEGQRASEEPRPEQGARNMQQGTGKERCPLICVISQEWYAGKVQVRLEGLILGKQKCPLLGSS